MIAHNIYDDCHDDNSNQRSRYLFGKSGRDGNNKYTDNPYYKRPRIDRMEMFEVSNPFGDKIGFFHRQSEQVFHLCRKNGQCDTAGKADNDRVGDELNDCAEF